MQPAPQLQEEAPEHPQSPGMMMMIVVWGLESEFVGLERVVCELCCSSFADCRLRRGGGWGGELFFILTMRVALFVRSG